MVSFKQRSEGRVGKGKHKILGQDMPGKGASVTRAKAPGEGGHSEMNSSHNRACRGKPTAFTERGDAHLAGAEKGHNETSC